MRQEHQQAAITTMRIHHLWGKIMRLCGAFIAVITMGFTPPSLGASRDAALTRLENGVQVQRKRFAKHVEVARAALLGEFERKMAQINRLPSLSLAAKQQQIQLLSAERSAFSDKGRLPESDEMLWPTIHYVVTLRTRSVPLCNAYDLLANNLARDGDLTESKKVTAEKLRILNRVIPHTAIESGQAWHGFRHFQDSSADFHLLIDEMDDPLLRGRVKTNRGWSVLKVSGSLDGCRISIQTTRVEQGKHRWLKFDGYLFDDRMVLWTSGITVRKKPANDYIVLCYNAPSMR